VVAARAGGEKVGRNAPFQEALIQAGSSDADSGRNMKLIIPIIGFFIIIGLIGVAVTGIQNAFSSVKIEIVSASCETQEKFVSILKEALSGVQSSPRAVKGLHPRL
jgi:hypothetical protein